MCRIVSEAEFAVSIRIALTFHLVGGEEVDCVTGPGRSGAIAAVYASHILGIPFIPYGQKVPPQLPRLLLIDTARQTGKTIRKAQKKYEGFVTTTVVVYEEPPRVAFWYESAKPQHYKHERIADDGKMPIEEGSQGFRSETDGVGNSPRVGS